MIKPPCAGMFSVPRQRTCQSTRLVTRAHGRSTFSTGSGKIGGYAREPLRERVSSVAPLLLKAAQKNSNRGHQAFLRKVRRHHHTELRENYFSARSNCRRWTRRRAARTGSIGRRSTARNANNGSH